MNVNCLTDNEMQPKSKENDAQERTAERNQQCDSVIEEFRGLVETYIFEDKSNGKFCAKEIPSSVLNNACKHLDMMLNSHLFENIQSEIEYVFNCLDLFARVTINIPRELESIYIRVCIQGIMNDSIFIMQGCHNYFGGLLLMVLTDELLTNSFEFTFEFMINSRYRWCGSEFGQRFVLSGLALDYLGDRIAYLRKEENTDHNVDTLSRIDLAKSMIFCSFILCCIHLYSLTLGAIIASCIVVACMVWAVRILSSCTYDIMVAFRRFSPFVRIWRALFIAVFPWLIIWLNMSDTLALVMIICSTVLYVLVESGIFRLFRKNVARQKFTPHELILMFGV